MKEKYILELQELSGFAQELVHSFPSGVVILQGDLAAGKTTLVKAVAKALKLQEDVTSPTFSLQQVYGDRLYHYDMYNHGLEHFLSLGMLEELEKEGVHFIEWGDDTLKELLDDAGLDTLTIQIRKISPQTREYTLCTH